MPSMRELRIAAARQGWRVRKTNGSHFQFVPADPAQRPVYAASTPSDQRALSNVLADLRRSGFRWPI